MAQTIEIPESCYFLKLLMSILMAILADQAVDQR